MGQFRKPWLIVFLGLLAFYTYKVLSNAGSIAVQPSSAKASSERASTVKKIHLSQAYQLPQASARLEIKAFESMDVSIVQGTTGEGIELVLSGEGESYLGSGENLEDWLKVSVSGNTMGVFTATSPSKKTLDFWSNRNDLHLKILVPSAKAVSRLEISTVSGDVLISGLVVEDLVVRGVSGDCSLKKGGADRIRVQTVSGDLESTGFVAKEANVKSVSGDVELEASGAGPSYAVKTVSGDLEVRVPPKAVPQVQFQSLSGELLNTLGKNPVSAGAIRFSSLSGDAKILR